MQVFEGRNERLMFCVSFCCMIVAATKLSSSYKGWQLWAQGMMDECIYVALEVETEGTPAHNS